jgi:hypothetical protein
MGESRYMNLFEVRTTFGADPSDGGFGYEQQAGNIRSSSNA